ncbi:MAG: biotin transporter BioY [Oscillibacter sp.]|uniref:biotin transporter BioY n=1 Tax=uncultured Oscillibacter sp. TaxID=876091 RepID=UPI00216BE475|nr:biotin transporter BioY [uncultured Oscillibacter sp.]MCI9644921.1 biotin transporter BioY [Oscillibacter sp.]
MPEKTVPRLGIRDLTLIALFTALTAVCAWISVPVPAPFVQFTMQTFAVFAVLLVLGGKRGTYAVTAYLLLGAVGAPVFSNFRGGLGVLLGTTGGYILGFFFQALLYWWMTAKLGEALRVKIAASVLGLALCYAFGTAWYLVLYAQAGNPMGLMTALGYCVFPFVIPDLLKLALAALLARRIEKYVQ